MRISSLLLGVIATSVSAAGPPQISLDMSKFETALSDYFVDQKVDSMATLEAKLGEKAITFCKNVYVVDAPDRVWDEVKVDLLMSWSQRGESTVHGLEVQSARVWSDADAAADHGTEYVLASSLWQ
jgi:hypothetical protein